MATTLSLNLQRSVIFIISINGKCVCPPFPSHKGSCSPSWAASTGTLQRPGVSLNPAWSDCTKAFSKANLCIEPLVFIDSYPSQRLVFTACFMQCGGQQAVALGALVRSQADRYLLLPDSCRQSSSVTSRETSCCRLIGRWHNLPQRSLPCLAVWSLDASPAPSMSPGGGCLQAASTPQPMLSDCPCQSRPPLFAAFAQIRFTPRHHTGFAVRQSRGLFTRVKANKFRTIPTGLQAQGI